MAERPGGMGRLIPIERRDTLRVPRLHTGYPPSERNRAPSLGEAMKAGKPAAKPKILGPTDPIERNGRPMDDDRHGDNKRGDGDSGEDGGAVDALHPFAK